MQISGGMFIVWLIILAGAWAMFGLYGLVAVAVLGLILTNA